MVVLEALAEGLPVIGSSVVQWLIEGAGEVVVGEDTEPMPRRSAHSRSRSRRRQLSEVALERARAFSWESSAAGYVEVLDASTEREGTSIAINEQDNVGALQRAGRPGRARTCARARARDRSWPRRRYCLAWRWRR